STPALSLPDALPIWLGRLRLGLDGFHAFFGLRLEGLLGRELFVEGRLEIEILLEALAEFLQLVLGGRPAEGPRGLRAHGDLRQAARLARGANGPGGRSEEHTSELQSRETLVC